ncbi:unnamed protein product [Vicia faba]|uniref:Uncharacterized protein n=1 Tax=Vicia faba TaxID=3906 RepID=A0AAV1A8N6_VICFA|nr:unnamed protein product [Vicia faba]
MEQQSQLLEAATDFAHYPGSHSDDSARQFLNRFPLPLIINALQTQFDVPALETTLVLCLERLFKTKFGASFIPQYMAFVQVGLQADSQAVRSLACKTVTCLVENLDNSDTVAAHLVKEFNIYPLLLDCLINGESIQNVESDFEFLVLPNLPVAPLLSPITGPTIESPESTVNPMSSPITDPSIIDPTSILVPSLSSVLHEPSSSTRTKTKAGEPTMVYHRRSKPDLLQTLLQFSEPEVSVETQSPISDSHSSDTCDTNTDDLPIV